MKARTLIGAILVDAALGDPRWLPHPVSGIGVAITALYARHARHRRSARHEIAIGAASAIAIVVGCAALAYTIVRAVPGARVPLAASALAMGSLADSMSDVLSPLERGDVRSARIALARIVGRDVDDLDASDIVAATIESFAESLCDGVLAPLLALAVGGCSGAYAFKAASTLDSMVGHIEQPYTFLGRFAARLDDVLNFVPARVTAFALLVVSQRSWADVQRTCIEARGHASPNAGWTEAAMACALAVRLGGPATYSGIVHDRAMFFPEARAPSIADAYQALRLGRWVYVLVATVTVLGVCVARG